MSLAQYAEGIPVLSELTTKLKQIKFPELGSTVPVTQYCVDTVLGFRDRRTVVKSVLITRGFLDTFNSFIEHRHAKLIGYPLCGKTTLLMLIKRVLESAGIHCTYLRFWQIEGKKDVLKVFTKSDILELKFEFDTFVEDIKRISEKGVVLFDEIQKLKRSNRDVYCKLLSTLVDGEMNNFFAAGIITSIEDAEDKSERKINRILSSKLRLRKEESELALPMLKQLNPMEWRDGDAAHEIVSFALAESNNMIGVAEHMLTIAKKSFEDQIERGHLDVVKAKNWIERAQFEPDKNCRLAPCLNALSMDEGVIDLLRSILLSVEDVPEISVDTNVPIFLLLFQSGLVEFNEGTGGCSFVSRWARRLCKHVVAVHDSKSLNAIEYDWKTFDPAGFIDKLLANSNWEMIYRTASIRADHEISEHVFQQTFYSTILKMLEAAEPSERPVASPEKYCGQDGDKGYLDHYVNSEVRLGIEYLVGNKSVKKERESDGIPDFEDHAKRFDCAYKGIPLQHRICIALTKKENVFNAYKFDFTTSVPVYKFAVLVDPKTCILKIRWDDEPTATKDLPWIPIQKQDERPAKRCRPEERPVSTKYYVEFPNDKCLTPFIASSYSELISNIGKRAAGKVKDICFRVQIGGEQMVAHFNEVEFGNAQTGPLIVTFE